MIRKVENHNRLRRRSSHPQAHALETEGHTLVRGAFSLETVEALREELDQVFRTCPPDPRDKCLDPDRGAMFRYEMFNRSERCQQILERREILDVIEPLLGDDCHVVACTAWRNPPNTTHAPFGQEWHVDGGPHVVRPEGIPWPDAIPYPIFVVGVHVYVQPVRLEDGPTAVIPGSHRSGCLPPAGLRWDLDLSYEGRHGLAHVAEPGDVSFFVSDSWHRRLPPLEGTSGRFFLQINYGRREIAQRILPGEALHPASAEALERARTPRARQLLGIHQQGFYDG
ncbi:MAG: phytanoyl-CoA dioxygenase family protein [Planctomycetota bacterium]